MPLNQKALATRWMVAVISLTLILILCLEHTEHALSPLIQSVKVKGSRLNNVMATNETVSDSPTLYNLTIVVPGLGDPLRLPIVKRSLLRIQESFPNNNSNTSYTTTNHHEFHCIVYVYKKSLLSEAVAQFNFCNVVYNEGMWTSHMKHVPSLESTTHVAIMMDDIDVATHKLDAIHMIHRMDHIGYGAVSAAVVNWTYSAMHPRTSCTSHRTDYADILFVIFEHSAWKCWQDNLNLTLNKYGWGYDVTLSDICNITIGVIDTAIVLHSPPVVENVSKRSYNRDMAVAQQNVWLNHIGQSHPEVKCLGGRYQEVITRTRPFCFRECDADDDSVQYFTECLPGSACSNRECMCLAEPPPVPIPDGAPVCEAPGWHMVSVNGDGCSNDNDYPKEWLDHQKRGYKMFLPTYAACCDQFFRGKDCKKYDIGCVVSGSFNISEIDHD